MAVENKDLLHLRISGPEAYSSASPFDLRHIDVNDRDSTVTLKKWPAYEIYLPDAVAVYEAGDVPYLFTANKGDACKYAGFRGSESVQPAVNVTVKLKYTETQKRLPYRRATSFQIHTKPSV